MKTITVQIGNSDDKLSQKEWSEYVDWVDSEIRARAFQVHFFGTSLPIARWQNACWVFEIDHNLPDYEVMKVLLRNVAQYYKQESIAFTVGDTLFLHPGV